jgi:tripartite motif-containing protein 71
MQRLLATIVSIVFCLGMLASGALASSHPARHAAAGARKTSSLFRSPFGIVRDARGNIYVTDSGRNRVAILSPQGKLLASWSTHITESGAGNEDTPSTLGITPHGYILVADTPSYAPSRLEEFTASGKFLSVCCDNATALGVGFGGIGYIAYSDPNRIERIAASGKVTATWHTLSPPNSSSPRFVAGDAQGNVYVDFLLDNEVQKLGPTGKTLAVWRLKKAPGFTGGPAGIAVDAHGNVYVANDELSSITKFAPSGKVLSEWTSDQGYVTDKGNFDSPEGITLDARGDVFVTDLMNSRVQVLSPRRKVLAVFK